MKIVDDSNLKNSIKGYCNTNDNSFFYNSSNKFHLL